MENIDKYLGKRLEGRYEIQTLIGTGGMANVYKAFDIIDQRTVAVKILRDEFLDNAEFLRRFKNESKAIAVLSHPNIVKVFDVSFTNRIHSIVMEYIDGITLKDYIERQGALSWKETIHFTLQILRALQHAHDKGIVHRDIKPQNIMMLADGTLKVTDFGIARFARSEVKTITDRAIGSVHYISPEQAMGENTDEKSDIYSVGVMMFEMLTGKLPFEAETAVSVALKQIQTQAAMPRSINPSIPEGLEDITVRAMQKDATRRYQSAAEMIDNIEKFKQNPSIHFEYKYLDTENESAQRKKFRRAITETREGDEMQQKKRRVPYIPILTGVTFAFVLASVAFIGLMVFLNNPFTKVEEFKLPNLVGLKYETARAQYLDRFEIVMEEHDYNDAYGKGVIYEQDPKADKPIKDGSVVYVKISDGAKVITLPDFAERDAAMVFSKLTEQGLEYVEKRIHSSDTPIGSVVYTDPSKDSEVKAGTVITVYVSQGPEEVLAEVRDLSGLKLEDAQRILDVSRLKVGNITYEESDLPTDTIIGQDPNAGMLQPEGTAINLTVSKGSDSGFKRLSIPIQLPDDINRLVTISAKQDGVVVHEETLNPAEISSGVWSPAFQGEDEIVEIQILIDGQIYQEYELDFFTEGHTKLDERLLDLD